MIEINKYIKNKLSNKNKKIRYNIFINILKTKKNTVKSLYFLDSNITKNYIIRLDKTYLVNDFGCWLGFKDL